MYPIDDHDADDHHRAAELFELLRTTPNPELYQLLGTETDDAVIMAELDRLGHLRPFMEHTMAFHRGAVLLLPDGGILHRFQYHAKAGDSGFTWTRFACKAPSQTATE